MTFFDYDLPKERIAQWPVSLSAKRSDSKLLQVRRSSRGLEIQDRKFSDLSLILKKGDLLVLNNSKVLPSRFFLSHKAVEVLLVREVDEQLWEAFAKPMKKLAIGESFLLCPDVLAEVVSRTEDNLKLLLRLSSETNVYQALYRAGSMPIPPYIREGRAEEKDKEIYQTVYAEIEGSIAAPTAGLHFTTELLDQLDLAGIKHTFITLHVGSASFQPVREEDYRDYKMPEEYFSISQETLAAIERTKKAGGRVVAVGTTTSRALETVFNGITGVKKDDFYGTSLYINPGFQFKAVDVLITNFHQPKTTHLLMVAAFIGEKEIEDIYQHALKTAYRFLSYGDAMILEYDRQI